MTSTSTGPIPPPPVDRSGSHAWRVAVVALLVAVLVGVAVWWFFFRPDFGDPTLRVASPTGEFEVVQYEFSAMIDPGWNLAIERVDGDGREWFWRSIEGPGPEEIRFSGPTSVEVTDEYGDVYEIDFDPASLKPSERFCLRPEYCHSAPWDGYTRVGP